LLIRGRRPLKEEEITLASAGRMELTSQMGGKKKELPCFISGSNLLAEGQISGPIYLLEREAAVRKGKGKISS